MRRQIIVLLCIFLGFMSILLLLPPAPTMKPSRLAKDLPLVVVDWDGKPREPGEGEKKILAQDTEFERMEYVDWDNRKAPIEVSIVFSGKNLTQSIHRPEVCLRAQGWEFITEKYMTMEGVLPKGNDLPVKELICRKRRMKKEGESLVPVLNANGETLYDWRASYYTFFGYEKIVSGHYERTIQDMRDRIIGGFDQRWAYATFGTVITSKYVEQGISVGRWPIADETGTRKQIAEFLSVLLPMVVSEPGKGKDESLVDANSDS